MDGGGAGFKLMYLRFSSCGISCLLFFIVFLTCVWNVLVGSVLVVWKLLSCRKSCILDWYCVFGRTTIELPLSAHVITALLSLNLVWMDFIILASGCVWRISGFVLFSRNVSMRLATSFLYASLSVVGSCVMAVSASRARFCNQFFCFACVLYFRPFWSRFVSLLLKVMLVLFITLGWNVCISFGVLVCVRVNLASLVAIVLYLCCASFCNFSSIVLWMYGHELFQKLARAM